MVLEERAKREMLAVYVGDLVWSVLGCLHALGGGKARIPSCSEMYMDFVAGRKPEMSNKSVKASVEQTIRRFLKG